MSKKPSKKSTPPSIEASSDEEFYTFAVAYAANSANARLVPNRDYDDSYLPLSKLTWISDIIKENNEDPIVLMYNTNIQLYIGVCSKTFYTIYLPSSINKYINHQ